MSLAEAEMVKMSETKPAKDEAPAEMSAARLSKIEGELASLKTAEASRSKAAEDAAKAEIIRTGVRLGVDLSVTHSCYDPVRVGADWKPCGHCDSCLIRARGFAEAGLTE